MNRVPRASTTITAADRKRSKGARVRSRGGRPSLEAAEKLSDRILDAAAALFLSHGYGSTSIEQIAHRAAISKRTFYARFDDKAAVFEAVMHRVVETLRPASNVPLIEGRDLKAVLRHLAALILDAALAPQAIALHRLIVGESARFPKLAAAVNRNAASEEGVAFIAELLKREVRAGTIKLDEPQFAARHFLQMVIVIPQRAAMGLGAPMNAAELRAWPDRVVALFLEGCRIR